MFEVLVTDEVTAFARDLVAEGRFGRRGVADGSIDQQTTGLIGQIVVHDLLGAPRPSDLGRADGGVDLIIEGMAVDVKTMGRCTAPRPEFANNLSGLQIHFPAQAYIFCSLNKRTQVLTICGWITKIELLERADFHRAGAERRRADGIGFRLIADLYEISNADLYAPGCLADLEAMLELQAGLFAGWGRRTDCGGQT